MPGILDFGIKYDDQVNTKEILDQQFTNIESLEEYLNKMYASNVGVQFE